MKRALFSLVLSTILVIGYLIVAAIIVVLLSKGIDNLDRNAVYLVDVPLRIPKIVYFYFFSPTAEDYSMKIGPSKAVLAVFFYVANIFIYSVPIYGILSICARFGKKRLSESISPPPPPTF